MTRRCKRDQKTTLIKRFYRLAVTGVFGIYLGLISLLIPMEENGLRKAYGDQYVVYQQKTRKLIPFIY